MQETQALSAALACWVANPVSTMCRWRWWGPSRRAASDQSPVLSLPRLPCASQWDAFSIPELQNFLTILEKEEQDKIQQVQKKYDKFRQKLEEALRESQGKPG